ncbi:UDP-N-acetylenolpyruvoylglucosamine reductase [Runella sp. SP2]|nr:UDP-N-acetylenolpyruvoylglucosamine reductase [Runella sp. SP2]
MYLKSANGKFVIADDLLVKKFTDEFGEDYYRAVINDSKLTSKSPWTDNQATELIDIFKRKTPTPPTYIEFEVRTSAPELLKQGVPLGLTTGTTVRIYRSDVYKTISNGGGGFGQTIKMF